MSDRDRIPSALVSDVHSSPGLEGKILVKDDAWWAANLESASEKFKQWQLAS